MGFPVGKDGNYDCGFADASGNFIGLTLVRDENGAPRYAETSDPNLAQQFFTGLPGYANFEPEKLLQVGQGDWVAGYGQEYFDYDDERRYFSSTNCDARFKGLILAGPYRASVSVTNSGVVRAWAQFNGSLYIAADKTLYRLTTDGVTSVNTFDDNITHLKVFSDDYLYIAAGNGTKIEWMDVYENFTPSTEPDGEAHFLERVGSTMWKAKLPNELKSSTDPNGNSGTDWSTATTVDSALYNITGLIEADGTLYPMKEDMPYYMDSGGSVYSLIPSLRSDASSTSGRNAIEWQGKLYIPSGEQTLTEYDHGNVTDISPSKYITNSSDYSGRISALVSDSQYLYAVIDNDTKVEILAGRWEYIDRTRWVWHPLAELTMTGAMSAIVSTIWGVNRLYIGPATAGENIQYIDLHKEYGNVVDDNWCQCVTGGNIITPWHHANFKADSKAWFKLTLTMEDTSSTVYWQAYYQKLGDASWTEINSTAKFKTSPVTEAYIPVDGSSNKPTSTMMRFKFTPICPISGTYFTLDTSALDGAHILAYKVRSPVLLNYDVRAIWFPTQFSYSLLQVRVADNILLRNGISRDDTQTAKSLRTAINALKNPTTAWPRAFYPPYWESATDTVYVKLLQPVEWKIYKDEKTNNFEWLCDLALEIVTGVTF